MPGRGGGDDAPVWDVTRFPLGMIWFDLMNDPSVQAGNAVTREIVEEGVEYRLVPDPTSLAEARKILEQSFRQQQQQQQQQQSTEPPDFFPGPFNEIPVFVDQFLRVVSEDGSEMVPMYLDLQDLAATCQQAAKAALDGEYESSVNVADLRALVGQMRSKSAVNFRQAVIIPTANGDGTTENENVIEAPPEKMKEEIDLPMATEDLWSD